LRSAIPIRFRLGPDCRGPMHPAPPATPSRFACAGSRSPATCLRSHQRRQQHRRTQQGFPMWKAIRRARFAPDNPRQGWARLPSPKSPQNGARRLPDSADCTRVRRPRPRLKSRASRTRASAKAVQLEAAPATTASRPLAELTASSIKRRASPSRRVARSPAYAEATMTPCAPATTCRSTKATKASSSRRSSRNGVTRSVNTPANFGA
jgi:hypothetical protein